jgi:hypothetical protein
MIAWLVDTELSNPTRGDPPCLENLCGKRHTSPTLDE